MIARVEKLKKYCSNYMDIENYQEAVSSPDRWDLHHRMEIQPDGIKLSRQWMIEHDIYYNVDPCMLIFLAHDEHAKIHNSGKDNNMFGRKHSISSREKISSNRTGKCLGEDNKMFGINPIDHPKWKGDQASDHTKRLRLKRCGVNFKEEV